MVTLPEATNDTLALVKAAPVGVVRTWRERWEDGYRYSKAGVVTTDLTRSTRSGRALLANSTASAGAPLMAAMDACNARFGRGGVVPAARAPPKREW